MRQVFTLFGIVTVLYTSCGKTPGIDNTISQISLSSDSIDADGASTDTISVVLANKNASTDRRSVLFTTSGGTLAGAVHDSLRVTADFRQEQLYAKAILTAPASAGSNIIVTAAPVYHSSNSDYIRSKTIIVKRILPASIHLEPSSFGIGSNFINTDTFIATLKGPNKQKVSTGAKVIFESSFNSSNPTEFFRSQRLSSDGNSQVMALYSSPGAPIGTIIIIKVTVLNDNGEKTNISDMVTITVNQ